MSYTRTLLDSQADIGLKKASGQCPTSEDFIYLINSAVERLMTCGNWFGTEQLARLCVYNKCITWPRYVGTVLAVRLCQHSVDIKNHWYSIVGPASHCGLSSSGSGWAVVKDTGQAATFAEISNSGGSFIRIYAVKKEDWGKTVKLFGVDFQGQPLQEKVAGVWQMGLTLTLASPYVQSALKVSRIESVLKQTSQGNVLMYEVDPDLATNIKQLALYEPSETNPRYRRSDFSGLCVRGSGCKDANDDPIRRIDALIKLEYIPVALPDDFLLIDDFVALKFMVQCIRFEEAGENGRAQEFELKAIRQLNLRDRDRMPANQTPVVVSPLMRCLVNPI